MDPISDVRLPCRSLDAILHLLACKPADKRSVVTAHRVSNPTVQSLRTYIHVRHVQKLGPLIARIRNSGLGDRPGPYFKRTMRRVTDSPKKMFLCGVIGVAISVSGAGIAGAECPYVTAAQGKSMATAIFSGVATTITTLNFSRIVTFDVERVWQGTVGKKVNAYQVASSEERPFVVGLRYVVFAHPRNLSGGLFDFSGPGIGSDARLKIEEDKQRLERIDLGITECIGGPADGQSGQRLIGELGPSHAPD
jgi:hypothetical protein